MYKKVFEENYQRLLNNLSKSVGAKQGVKPLASTMHRTDRTFAYILITYQKHSIFHKLLVENRPTISNR